MRCGLAGSNTLGSSGFSGDDRRGFHDRFNLGFKLGLRLVVHLGFWLNHWNIDRFDVLHVIVHVVVDARGKPLARLRHGVGVEAGMNHQRGVGVQRRLR